MRIQIGRVVGVLFSLGLSPALDAQTAGVRATLGAAQGALQNGDPEAAAERARGGLAELASLDTSGIAAAAGELRDELYAVVEKSDPVLEARVDVFDAAADQCLVQAAAYLADGWLDLANDECDLAERLLPGSANEMRAKLSTARRDAILSRTVAPVVLDWKAGVTAPPGLAWEVEGDRLTSSGGTEVLNRIVADYRPAGGVRMSATIVHGKGRRDVGFVLGLQSQNDYVAVLTRVIGAKRDVTVMHWLGNRWREVADRAMDEVIEGDEVVTKLVVDTLGDAMKIRVGDHPEITVRAEIAQRVGCIGLASGDLKTGGSPTEFRDVRVDAAEFVSPAVDPEADSSELVEKANALAALGQKQAAVQVLRVGLERALDAASGAVRSRQTKEVRDAIEAIDPHSSGSRAARVDVAKGLLGVAKAYGRQKWHATALEVTELAHLFDPWTARRPLEQARREARSSRGMATAMQLWMSNRTAIAGLDRGWSLDGDTLRSPVIRGDATVAVASKKVLQTGYRARVRMIDDGTPSKSAFVFAGVPVDGPRWQYSIAEIYHGDGFSELWLYFWHPDAGMQTVSGSAVWYTPSERRAGIELTVEFDGTRARAKIPHHPWLEMEHPFGNGSGGIGFFVSGDSPTKTPVTFTGLELERLRGPVPTLK